MHIIELHLSILIEQQISDSSHIPFEGKNTVVELQEDQGSWSCILSLQTICSKNVSLGPA